MASPDTTTLSLERYAADAKAVVASAQALADERKHAEVLPLHLLSRMLERDPGVVAVFRSASVDVVELQAATERALGQLPKSKEPAYLSAAMLDLLERAGREAERERAGNVAIDHLLNALSQEIRGPAGEILGAMGIAPGSLRNHLSALRSVPRGTPRRPVEAGKVGEYTHDWVEDARGGRLDPVIGRDAEVRRLTTILERRQKNNTLLVGEPGVGKGAVIAALAQRIADGDVPTTLAGVRLLEIDTPARWSQVHAAKRRRRAHAFALGLALRRPTRSAGARGTQRGPAVRARTGRLRRGGFPQVATPPRRNPHHRDHHARRPAQDHRQRREHPAGLHPRCPSTSPASTARSRFCAASRYVQIATRSRSPREPSTPAVRLAKRYLQDRFLPDSAIDLLDETAAAKRVEADGIPAPVDAAMRRAESLRAQLRSLERTDDATTRSTRDKLSREISPSSSRVTEMKSKLESRRGAVAAVRALKNELDAARARARRSSLQERLRSSRRARARDAARPREALHRRRRGRPERRRPRRVARRQRGEPVASTLAIWTGIPVAKMLEGEADEAP
ncbi:MAG: Clp protease N-terminal domain-containing protein [Polyangiaceae bacterium]